MEAPLKKFVNFDGSINSQEYKSFEIYAVTIKISMTEYHHWINGQAYHFSTCRAMQLRFFKVETLLNIAFKWRRHSGISTSK